MKAPFPWFGGKSRVQEQVWDRFGDVRNYVEPFAGSLAVLLGRPSAPKIETVNDLDCWIANFWRALAADPEQLAHHADWPVNEADLHARHLWLVKQTEFRERMKTDPDFFDIKIAGWWVWGISQWIGSGWCTNPEWLVRPALNETAGILSRASARGGRKRPRLGNDHGRGVLNAQVPNQLPSLSGAAGREIHASGLSRKIPMIANGPQGTANDTGVELQGGLYGWFYALSDRLRRVRVCCGDWQRILGPAPTTCIGTTGVFLDPPYAVEDRSDVYGEESRDVAHAVREWAIAHGDNPDLRIALCGYDTEHKMPASWDCVAWKAAGGYGSQGNGSGRENSARERIWFSPYCLQPQYSLFANDAVCGTIAPK